MSFLGPAISGGASALVGGLLAGRGTKEKRRDPERPAFQRQLIDQLLQGLQGQGPLASIFEASPEAFQKSVADPLMQQFSQKTAPQIQQKFISQGQQRGTGLEQALAGAGADVQSQIAQQFLPFQQQAQGRQQQAINTLLGLQEPQPQFEQEISPLGGALAGLQSSGAISELIRAIGGQGQQGQQQQPKNLQRQTSGQPERLGFF